MPIFQWQRTQHINVWRMVGGNMLTLTCLWLTVRVGYNVETKVKDQDGSLENMLNVFSVLLVTRTLSNGTINGGN